MNAFRLLVAASAVLAVSCAHFRDLGRDLKLIESEYRVSGIMENADEQSSPVRAIVVEWNPVSNKVFSADLIELGRGGVFAFIVKNPANQYIAAHADTNRDGRYDKGEPFWLHRDARGEAAPVTFDSSRKSQLHRGRLSPQETPPPALLTAIADALQGRDFSQFITKHSVRFAIGELAELDDTRFATTRGEDGLWRPLTNAMESDAGLYFLEDYDPALTPVLFVHGAAGSPQDWRLAMERIDRKRYQPWFFVYPSGMRLDNVADSLNEAVKSLHERHQFTKLHVVAHSMGGLVSRRFIEKNVLVEGHSYLNTFITFSSPWGGHEAAAIGVKRAPEVVPSWRDMANGSEFLDHLFDRRLKGKVRHHLFYSHRASRSPILPAENDGTVSVASQTRKEAVADAVETRGFDETHMSILTSREALTAARSILNAASP
jgi:pimeloyl-ACP methyl ester carboxylesterase